MGKKVKEYKSGDFIFAKVKGYPAWPARVQRLNGKKYFVYFYGTGETANLPPNMIFDYAENKDKFLTKTVKRRDFNDGVKQIEHDFANNVPLEQVIGTVAEPPVEEDPNDTANDTVNDTVDDSAMDTTTADDTIANTTVGNATTNDAAIEDSDETGALVIDEGKQKPRKSSVKPAAKEAPKTPKTPRGRPKKEDAKTQERTEDEEDKQEEIVSRSGRKIRPKRYLDEQTEENATLPSPAPKKRRASPPPELAPAKEKQREQNIKDFNNVTQSELEDLKEPYRPADAEKDNILITYLPTGQYVGVRLFDSRPSVFRSAAARLQWDRQAAANAITLKMQLEKGHITPQSIIAQLVMDLNLTDEEKATLDKERETEEKRSRVQFLKTEMKLIELDAKIKTCLCLEKADTELCLKLLDELTELDVKPLMLLKHPGCVETLKRLRAYVGNAPSWELSEAQALLFARQAHRIRRQADTLYTGMKKLFDMPAEASFWEWFSARALRLQALAADLPPDQLLEMVTEPPELSQPSAHSMSAALAAADAEEPPLEDEPKLNNKTAAKTKKANNTPAKTPAKRQNSRREEKEKQDKQKEDKAQENAKEDSGKAADDAQKRTDEEDSNKEVEVTPEDDTEKQSDDKDDNEKESNSTEDPQKTDDNSELDKDSAKESEKKDGSSKVKDNSVKGKKGDKDCSDKVKDSSDKAKESSDEVEEVKDNSDKVKENNDKTKESSDKAKDSNNKGKEGDKVKESSDKVKDSNDKAKESSDKVKENSEKVKDSAKGKESDKKEEKKEQKEKEDEPRAKRVRGENKKTEPPPRSPAKRKSKA